MNLCLILNMAPHYRKGIFELLDKEFDCHFICGDKTDGIKPLDMSFINGSYEQVKRFSLPGHLIWQRGGLRAIGKNYDSYIITGDYRDLSAWMVLVFGKLTRRKVYLWSHGWYGRESGIKKWIKKRFSHLSSGEFVYGDHAKAVMLSNGYTADRIFVIHNSLDYSVQLKARGELKSTSIYSDHFKNDNKTILFIGRLTEVKRLDMLVDAIGILAEKHEYYNLVFVGDGSMRNELESLAKDNNLTDVWFVGPVYDESKKAELIYNADLCVSPGNVGLTAIDSMMFGTPVATHNVFEDQMPEYETIKQGVTGFYFGKNKQSVAEGISSWFASYKDREEIRKACFEEIDRNWTPRYQLSVIKKALIN